MQRQAGDYALSLNRLPQAGFLDPGRFPWLDCRRTGRRRNNHALYATDLDHATMVCLYTHHTWANMASSREVIAALERAGWRQVRQKGSHVRLTSADGKKHVTVPHPKKDLKTGTLRAIEQQTGVTF